MPSLFPTSHKSHMPHDVVLLCPACQIPAQRASQKRQTQLERPFVNSDGPKYRTFPQIRHLRKLAGALLSHPGLPPSRRNQYMEEIGGFLGTDSVSPEQLEAVLQMEEKVLNPDYVPPSELLIQSLLQPPTDESSKVAPDDDSESSSSMDGAFEALEMFVREWRRHFVTTMRPRHLPQGWSVNSPVRCQGSTAVSSSAASTAFSSDV
jgi:exonuclease 3'-5' domain-containing protein 2